MQPCILHIPMQKHTNRRAFSKLEVFTTVGGSQLLFVTKFQNSHLLTSRHTARSTTKHDSEKAKL